VGSLRHPLGTADFAGFLLQAQSSRAEDSGARQRGVDMTNSLKQAAEFGVPRSDSALRLSAPS
jgi:branched-chain amino acid transport system substrate-binding protein